MVATAPPQLYTADEFMRIPDPIEGGYYELVNGELRLMSPSGGVHGWLGLRIGTMLSNYVAENDLGDVFSVEAGFKIFPDRETVRAPDVAFVVKGRLAAIPESYIPLAPDLAIEVVSPNDTWAEIDTKTEEYQTGGVRLIWVVVPRRHAVYVYRPDTDLASPLVFKKGDVLDGEDVIPGFSVKVSTLFNMEE